MKKLIIILLVGVIGLGSGANIFAGETGTSADQYDAVYDKSDVFGTWKWVNSNAEYPIFFEFGYENSLKLMRMRPGNTDIDNYMWKLSGSTIYYSRPAADQAKIYEWQIITLDAESMLLRDEGGDIWLERLTK